MKTKNNKPIFYAETGLGACIREAKNEDAARVLILREVGTYNGIQKLRLATEADIAWVKVMGG